MSKLKADIDAPNFSRTPDPSPLRSPGLTPQPQWTWRALNKGLYMQRMLFLGFTDFKITSRAPKGQAELLRMLFHYAQIPFRDEILVHVDWKSLMCKMPYGNLPVLWMDHNVYGEMNVIVRHLARHLDMMGKNEKEELVAETIFEQVQELKESDVLQKAYEELQERPDDNYEQAFEVILPSMFKQWEERIENTGYYVLISGFSIVDMAIFDFINQYRVYLPLDKLLVKHTTLQKHYRSVVRHPSLASYFEQNKDSIYGTYFSSL